MSISVDNHTSNRMEQDFDSESSTENELLMHTIHTLPPECRKFWKRRYHLFSKYDEGIYMTSELWFSVTPEKLAILIAKIVQKLCADTERVLDLCCGGGGNTIQFAKLFPQVYALDIKQINVDCTLHNCSIYGVESRVKGVTADWNKVAGTSDWIPTELKSNSHPFDFAFCSPPWGGTQYSKAPNSFLLEDMEPLAFTGLCESLSQISENFGFFLPKSSKLSDISKITRKLYGAHGKTRVIHLVEGGYPKGLLVLFGPRIMGDLDYQEIADSIEAEAEL